MEIDLTQVLNTLIAGGAIYAGIRIEIRYLWRDLSRVEKRVDRLEGKCPVVSTK